MTDYGRTMDIMGSGAECPPAGIYTFTIMDVSDPVEKAGFNQGDTDIQSTLTLTLSGYEYDPEDDEDFDWNSHSINHFAVWARYATADGPDKKKAIYKSPRSNSGKLLRALYGLTDETVKDFVLDLDDLIGRKFMAPLTEKDNGYPKLGDPSPARKPKKVKAPVIVEEDDDLFEEAV
jgi:hypothetical protein